MLRRMIDSLILLAALCLMISPYVFGYSSITTPAGVASFFGLGVFILSVIELSSPDYWEEAAIVFLGIVITASPWLFDDIDYISHKATETVEITGVIFVVCSILGILVSLGYQRSRENKQHKITI